MRVSKRLRRAWEMGRFLMDQPAAPAREFFFAYGYVPTGIPLLALRAGCKGVAAPSKLVTDDQG